MLHKNFQKNKNCHFGTLRSFIFGLKFPSKLFSKIRFIPVFKFKPITMICSAFPESCFNFLTQRFAKSFKKSFFFNHSELCFSPQQGSELFSKMLLIANFKFKPFRRLWLPLPKNNFNFVTQKICEKVKKYYFQTVTKFVFELRVALKHFSKMFPMARFKFQSFWMFSLAFRKNGLQLHHSKNYQIVKNAIFEYSEHSHLNSR